jgi:hypothetical protein
MWAASTTAAPSSVTHRYPVRAQVYLYSTTTRTANRVFRPLDLAASVVSKRQQREGVAVPVAEPIPAAVRTPRSCELSFKQQRELAGMEAAILTAEMRVSELEKTLNDPGFYVTRAKDAPSLIAELEAARTEVSRLYTRWSELDRIPK